jgi:hypothetical protein
MANFTTTGSDTFPAGHVIQTTDRFIGTTYTSVPCGNSMLSTVITGSITPSDASNSIIIFYDTNVYIHNTSSDTGFNLRLHKSHSGGTSTPSDLADGTSYDYNSEYWNMGTGDSSASVQRAIIDDAGGVAGSAITYTVQAQTRCGSSGFVSSTVSWAGRQWRIWFQEIQR